MLTQRVFPACVNSQGIPCIRYFLWHQDYVWVQSEWVFDWCVRDIWDVLFIYRIDEGKGSAFEKLRKTMSIYKTDKSKACMNIPSEFHAFMKEISGIVNFHAVLIFSLLFFFKQPKCLDCSATNAPYLILWCQANVSCARAFHESTLMLNWVSNDLSLWNISFDIWFFCFSSEVLHIQFLRESITLHAGQITCPLPSSELYICFLRMTLSDPHYLGSCSTCGCFVFCGGSLDGNSLAS